MKTNLTELPESRVRVDVDVDAEDLDRRMKRTAADLGRELKIPGFRKGKVPAEIVLQRVGREAVVEQTLRDALPEWYERALLDTGVSPIGDPKLDVSALPEDGGQLSFTIEVAVRPTAKLGDYEGLEVGRAEIEVPDGAVDDELEGLRERFASLKPVEREAAQGDYMLIDYVGTVDGEQIEGGEARDFMLELGAEGVLEGFEEALSGARAGDERKVEVTFPDDYRPESLAGNDAVFEVTVKEVREKELPELDDEFATQASEFDTLDELRDDIEGKIEHALGHRVEDQFREAAVDAAVEQAEVEVPGDVVTARASEMWERVQRQLQGQGIDPASYLKMQDRTGEQMVEEAKPEAERTLKREAVLTAVAEEAGVEVTEAEMLDALRPAAEAEETKPERVLERLRSSGREALLVEDLRMRKAVDAIASTAKPIPLEQAEAREKIWTPEKEEEQKGELWTPGSD